MTSGTEQEPALRDIFTKLNTLTTDVEDLRDGVEKFNDRFSNYQQATPWLVQLAFTLIASVTVTVLVTSVLRR